ncbi:MAG: glutamate--tRNA ligase [Phycisphaeraceae bacterium]|nr:glutamate--tRNA ligase [Phycisphaeraceae bacterium]
MSSTSTHVVTRFAPSPTGHLHIGGVRTALFNWAFARKHAGSFLLRIEDTDQARSSESSTRGILEDLAWCGIDWDEGPEFIDEIGRPIGGDPRSVGSFFQSKRLDLYNRVIDEMIERDLAYPAFDTPDQLAALRKEADAGKQSFRYKRSPSYDRTKALERMRAGEPCVVRFHNPDKVVRVVDEVLGDIHFQPEHTDDFVLRKADGFPTYHFAVVVDDQHMGVTHILRGQEHLNNTPRHVALQIALGYRTPVFAHLPLIFNADGSKMSKRDKDKAAREACNKALISAEMIAEMLTIVEPPIVADEVRQWQSDKRRGLSADALRVLSARINITLPEIDVEDFRRAGYLPDVICNYMALLGWNPGQKNPDGTDLEKFDPAFLAANFSLDRIGKTNSRFDRAKLASFNQSAIAAMPDAEFAERFRDWCDVYDPSILSRFDAARLDLLCTAAKPRVKTLSEVASPVGPVGFAFIPDHAVAFDHAAVDKALKKPVDSTTHGVTTGAALLRDFASELAALDPFTAEAIESSLKAFTESHGVKVGSIAQAIRVAVTGSTVSPGIGQTLAILGLDSCKSRIDRCLREVSVAVA